MQSNGEVDASRVVVSYPGDLESWERDALDTDHYRAYLRRTLGTVAVGDEREEFVNCGCGTRRDVVLRVVALEGGAIVDDGTDVEFVEATDAEFVERSA